MNRDLRNQSKPEYLIQVQLRFCLLETTCEQEDYFPPNVQLKVNGKMCQLPNPIATNKPGVEPKRPPRPVNITMHVKISPTVANGKIIAARRRFSILNNFSKFSDSRAVANRVQSRLRDLLLLGS